MLAAPACCVAASMLVRTVRGEVPAGEVAVGEVVWSVDVATGQRVAATVVQVRRATRECLALRWAGGSLVCTPDHPLYSPETGSYRPASDWITGTARTLLIAVEDGVRVVAVEGSETFAGMHEVIDLSLDLEPHNFVAAGVVVHNKSPATEISEDEQAGPTVELGPGESASFEIHVCADGEDHPLNSIGIYGAYVLGRELFEPATEWISEAPRELRHAIRPIHAEGVPSRPAREAATRRLRAACRRSGSSCPSRRPPWSC